MDMTRTLSSSLVAGAIALTVGTTYTWAAAERATFILTNGERVSGTVVFHTSERTNIRADTRQFSLGTNDGKEVHFEFDHVAVIDFVSGRPAQSELEALRPNSHTLAMRDGSTRRGLLVDLVGGDTVRWQREDGDRENVPIQSVRRIYMNTESARNIFNYQPGNSTPSSTVSGTAAVPAGAGIEVRANLPWTDGGITVQAGEMVRFSATGSMAYSNGPNTTSADGDTNVRKPNYPVPNAPLGALIGRIGTGTPFLIGGSSEPVRMPSRGRLYLSVNDDDKNDNSGGFRVEVVRNAR
jgi:hypothetical protein